MKNILTSYMKPHLQHKPRHRSEFDDSLEKKNKTDASNSNEINDGSNNTNEIQEISSNQNHMNKTGIPIPPVLKQNLLNNGLPTKLLLPHFVVTTRRSTYVEITFQRKDMNTEQRQVYDFVICQIRMITEYFQFLRNIQDYEFIKMIGQGGYGHIWTANDLLTGKTVAIKELHKIDGTKGSHLLRFIREVQTMIAARSRFVLPILGFTLEIPFSVITPYKSYGSLTENLSKNYINPTQKQIIALCIAQGVLDVHKAGVIHRDLKCSNILMDEDGLPLICDFGISRMFLKNKRMSKDLGTTSFMAPEVSTTINYDQKCDVYSYGMILYEISEVRQPFRKVPEREVKELVKSGVRPDFKNDKTPKNLKTLITKCWNSDPSLRPTFEEIILILSTGEALFKDANIKLIKEFWSKISNELSNFKPDELPPPKVSKKKILDEVKKQIFNNPIFTDGTPDKKITEKDLIVFEQPYMNRNEDFIDSLNIASPIVEAAIPDNNRKKLSTEILQNPNSPEFSKYLDYLSKNISITQYLDFFQNTISYLRGHWHCNQIIEILNTYTIIAKRDPNFLNQYMNTKLFQNLSKEAAENSFDLLAQLIHFRMELVSDNEIKLLNSFLKSRPFDAIYLFGEASMHFKRISRPLHLFDALIKEYQLFLSHKTGKIFLGIFHSIFVRSKSYREKRIKKIYSILPFFIPTIHHSDALHFMCRFYDDDFDIPLKKLMKYATENGNCFDSSAISLFLRIKKYPNDKKFIHLLVDSISSHPQTLFVLLKYVNESELGSKRISKYTKWMKVTEKDQIMLANQIFLSIFLNPSLRKIIICAIELPDFMKQTIELGSKPLLVAMNCWMKKVKCDQVFVNNLTRSGFFQALHKHTSEMIINDTGVVVICFMIIQTISSFGYSNDYSSFIDLIEMLLDNSLNTIDPILRKASIHIICSLCHFREIIVVVQSKPTIIKFFENLNGKDEKKYRILFQTYISK
ncbi:hypothetical protein TRFO_21914 [Tritrichomonas foetus]|uniref:Protein kinase domain-containing protein n=1 Tax=Tritrichomonas foetus TaxID=1144522 RepID=A0A1J4KHY4_9EUKA|nr:hypothetical protein TRFO_21914 [Tritrichomonas foetus]|eukprot:OHT09262.1 hypothetical protein TRFO_21914 [Tritrichomonas foetus]